MAVSFIAAGATVTTAISNLVIPVPTGYAANDLLIIMLSTQAAPIAPSGWTIIEPGSGAAQGQSHIGIYTKRANASETSVTITANSSNMAGVMVCYRGVMMIDNISLPYSSPSFQTNCPTNVFRTSFANDYIVSFYSGSSGNSYTWSSPASTTPRVNLGNVATNNSLLIVDELKALGGLTTSRSATLSFNQYSSNIAIALAPYGTNLIAGSGIQDFTSIGFNSAVEITVEGSSITPWESRILSNDPISISFPLEIPIDPTIDMTPLEPFSNDLLSISFPLETSITTSALLTPVTNDPISISFPLETSITTSALLTPVTNDPISISFPLEISINPTISMPIVEAEIQTYSPINISFPLELIVPVSSILAPFANIPLAISYPLQTPILSNQLNPRNMSIGFIGGSIYLNGTNGIDITEPVNNLYDIGTNFTAELWVNFTDDLTTPEGLLAKRPDIGITAAEWITLSTTADALIKLEVSSTSIASGWALTLIGTEKLAKNTWYHIAVVKSENNWNIYLNGKQYAFGTSSGIIRSTFNTLSIGAYASNETNALNGYIGGVRLIKDLAIYTSEFTIPNYEFTITQTVDQDVIPSLAIVNTPPTITGTVLLINPKYETNSINDSSSYSATISNAYTISNLSPLWLNLNTKFNNAFSTQAITAPFVYSISTIGEATGTTTSTITELWI